MLRLVDLANRSDFSVGPLRVSPARRLLEGPGGNAALEPIVMKVLLLLLDARGTVVTRDEIFASAWGGVFVGDDSLNRAVARARKALSEVAPGSFEIETIPRTGYRLTGEISQPVESSGTELDIKRRGVNRRTVIGASAGALVAGAAGMGLWSIHAGDERRFNELVKQGEDGLAYGDGTPEPIPYLRRAVAMRPNDAKAQGLLAFAIVAYSDNGNEAYSGAVDQALQAATISLKVDPSEPHARLALIELQRSTLDLAGTEDRLRQVLASAPDNILVMRQLWNLLQSAGRSREALAIVRRAIAVRPLAAGSNFPLAQFLWIVGQTAEADRVIDRAMQFWPSHQVVRFARFTIFAFAGRARAAIAMLNDHNRRPQMFSPERVALWRTSLLAIDEPSPTNIARARTANVGAAKADMRATGQAVMTLSALGELDAAFDVANALLVFSAPAVGHQAPTIREPRANSTAWRFTPWLFTPPVAPMEADHRFLTLADGIGLTAYWRARHVRPDYQTFA